MKILSGLFFSFLFLSCSVMNAQLPRLLHTHQTSEYGGNYPVISLPTSDSGAVIFGSNEPLSFLMHFQPSTVRTITKIGPDGSIRWSRSYDFSSATYTAANNRFVDACELPGNGFAICGVHTNTYNASPFASFHGQAYFMRLKPNGDSLWCRKFDDPAGGLFQPRAVRACRDSGVVFCGIYESSTPNRGFFGKFSKNGSLLWFRLDTSTTHMGSEFADIAELSDSSLVVSGKMLGDPGYSEVVMLTADKNGNVNSVQSLNKDMSSTQPKPGSLTTDNNAFYMTFYKSNRYVMKVSNKGSSVWSKKIPGFINEGLPRTSKSWRQDNQLLLVSRDQGVYALDTAGTARFFSVFGPYMDLVPLQSRENFILSNRNLNIVFRNSDTLATGAYQAMITNSLCSNQAACFNSYTFTSTSAAITFSTESFDFSSNPVQILATRPIQGTVTVSTNVGCLWRQTDIPVNSSKSFHIYPTPASGVITIEGAATISRVTVVDLAGKEVQTFAGNGNSEKIDIDCSSFAEGVYIAVITDQSGLKGFQKLIISR